MLESFKSLFKRREVEKIIADLKRFQSILGSFNDYENQQKIIKEYLRETGKELTCDEVAFFENIITELSDKQKKSAKEAKKLFNLFLKDEVIYDKLFG